MIVASWAAGLIGAYLGTNLAERRSDPPRRASTLGIVTAAPRASALPDLDVAAVAQTIGASVVAVQAVVDEPGRVGQSLGTGLVLTTDGEIITNAHVVRGAKEVNVRLAGETEPRRAAVIATDPGHDLALLRVDAQGLSPATFAAPGDVRVGDEVVAVGYALDLDGDPSVTLGIVSALDRSLEAEGEVLTGLIQTDAAISSGNSGGPLVNALGQVVGINTLIALTQQGSSANSLGFAINGTQVLARILVLRQPSDDTAAAIGFLGVGLSARRDGGSGALVAEVTEDSPAADAGIRVGDVVVAIDDVAIDGQASLVAAIRDRLPGDVVVVSLVRDGEALSVSATLGERIAD